MSRIGAVILAAGEGTRMHPLTYTRPKVMLPISNKPILEHLLLEMQKAGIEEFTFVVGANTRLFWQGREMEGLDPVSQPEEATGHCRRTENVGGLYD